MDVILRRFRWWAGLILGAAIGLAVWLANDALIGTSDPGVPMEASALAQLVRAGGGPIGRTRARMWDLRVYPPEGQTQLVTAMGGRLGRPDARVALRVTLPFREPRRDAGATDEATGGELAARPQTPDYPDMRAFLAAVAPSMRYRYAWWASPGFAAAASFGAPMLLFGVALPLALRAAVRAGWITAAAEPSPRLVASPTPAGTRAPKSLDDEIDPQAVAAMLGGRGPAAALPTDDARRAPTAAAAPTADAPASTPAADASVEAGTPRKAKAFDGGTYYPVHRPRRSGP